MRCLKSLYAPIAGTALFIFAAPLHAQAIYKCVDDHGGTLISNARAGKNCKAIAQTGGNNPSPAPKGSKTITNPSPADFPRVGDDTQKARDNDRKAILEQELASEQRNLDQAKKDLAQVETSRQPGETVDRAAPYRERITQHERNIEVIRKELGAGR